MIPKEILERYNMAEMDCYESEIDFYQTFLIQTDHIPNKIIEALIEDLASATITNFVKVFIDFIVAVRLEYKRDEF